MDIVAREVFNFMVQNCHTQWWSKLPNDEQQELFPRLLSIVRGEEPWAAHAKPMFVCVHFDRYLLCFPQTLITFENCQVRSWTRQNLQRDFCQACQSSGRKRFVRSLCPGISWS